MQKRTRHAYFPIVPNAMSAVIVTLMLIVTITGTIWTYANTKTVIVTCIAHDSPCQRPENIHRNLWHEVEAQRMRERKAQEARKLAPTDPCVSLPQINKCSMHLPGSTDAIPIQRSFALGTHEMMLIDTQSEYLLGIYMTGILTPIWSAICVSLFVDSLHGV